MLMDIAEFELQIISLKDKISRLAFYMLSNGPEAEDATQEVFIKLWNMRNELSVVENMQAYVLRMTRNLCLDKLRAQKRAGQLDDLENDIVADTTDNPHEQVEAKDALSVVKKMIASLPETQRTIITLRDIDGLEFDEIAEVTGLNDNAIKVNLSRARKKIREYFTNTH